MTPTRRAPGRTTPARPVLAIVAALCAAAVVAVLGLVTAGPAAAHDALVSTDPADGGVVATAPDAVTLTFDQPALAIGTTLRVIGPAGDVQSGQPRLVDETVTQDLAPGIPAGRYRIAWRVTSADGHPVSGELTFTASAANPRTATSTPVATGEATGPVSAPTSSGVPIWIWIVLAVIILGAGGVWLSRRGAASR